MKSGTSNSTPLHDGLSKSNKQRLSMFSIRVIFFSLLAVFLLIALGLTGGQVRELGNRVTTLEEERSFFQRKLAEFRADNLRLLSRIRDYQDVLQIAQQSNISLSKRLLNRDLAVEDLQRSIDVILEEKYANEQKLNKEIGRLEQIKRDLIAKGVALGESVVAQNRKIKQLEDLYRSSSEQLAITSSENEKLVMENERYMEMLFELEEKFVSVEQANQGLIKSFDNLQDRAVRLEAEKMELKEELRGWLDSELSRPGGDAEKNPDGIDIIQDIGEQETLGVVAPAVIQTRFASADDRQE